LCLSSCNSDGDEQLEELKDRERGISNLWEKGEMANDLSSLLFLYTYVFLLQIKASLSKSVFQAK